MFRQIVYRRIRVIVYSDVLLNGIKPNYSHWTCFHSKTLSSLCRECAVSVSYVFLGDFVAVGFYLILFIYSLVGWLLIVVVVSNCSSQRIYSKPEIITRDRIRHQGEDAKTVMN